ncbi:MAG: glycosyltransferase [Candidatus Scatovivens sp.]
MNKVLIFYGSYGGGHLSAAKSISEFLKNENPDLIIEMVDCIEYINKYLNKLSTEAYKEMAKKFPFMWELFYNRSQDGALAKITTTTNKILSHKIKQLIQEFNPDLIVSTHPFSSQMCAILRKRGKIDCKIATILTDYKIHNQWLYLPEYIDFFFVSNPDMKKDMISKNINAEKIFVTGIPVSSRFSENFNDVQTYSEFGLSPEKKTVLFFAGGEFGLGRNTTFMTLKAIIRLFKDTQVIAISGKNQRMKKRFKDLIEATNSSDRVKLLEFTNKIPELMHIADFVVTKPGGLTITESLVSNLPIIIINPIPGQEEENAEFLEKYNTAIWIKKGDNIARTLKNLYRNPEIFLEMSENTKKLANPNSTKDICKILLLNC